MDLISYLKNRTEQKDVNKDNSETRRILTGTERDYSELDNYEVALKFWLPEALDRILSEMCRYTESTRSDILRQTLFQYLYGRYDLLAENEKKELRFAKESNILFSRSASSTPALGKNTYDVKVLIAKKMKDDLQQMADKKGIKLSQFLREILISNLLGHTYLAERDNLIKFNIEIDSIELNSKGEVPPID